MSGSNFLNIKFTPRLIQVKKLIRQIKFELDQIRPKLILNLICWHKYYFQHHEGKPQIEFILEEVTLQFFNGVFLSKSKGNNRKGNKTFVISPSSTCSFLDPPNHITKNK